MNADPRVAVVPHRPEWAAEFERERAAMLALLGAQAQALHHIGSTAVPGLAAKPIIDMLLELRSLADFDREADRLQALGYQTMGEFGIPGRRYFRKGGAVRSHHLHAFEAGDAHLLRHLAFRDYLRCHEEARRDYAALKLRLAGEAGMSWDLYSEGKDAFVKRHEALALAWLARGRS